MSTHHEVVRAAGQPERYPDRAATAATLAPGHSSPRLNTRTKPADVAPLLIAAKQGFALIGVGRSKGFELIRDGQLRARKLGARTMIERDSLLDFVTSLPQAGSKPKPPQRPSEPVVTPEVQACEAACRLAAAGYACFPCRQDGEPVRSDWLETATNDQQMLRTVWHETPGELVGIALGQISGIELLYLEGVQCLVWLMANRWRLPPVGVNPWQYGTSFILFRHEPGTIMCLPAGAGIWGDGARVVFEPAAAVKLLAGTKPSCWSAWMGEEGVM